MIEFASVITNGYVDSSTISSYIQKGWTFVTTVPASLIHPHAMPTDKATIFSKYSGACHPSDTIPQSNG